LVFDCLFFVCLILLGPILLVLSPLQVVAS
jgi:hypothetical protein